jgi:hypothetical protein
MTREDRKEAIQSSFDQGRAQCVPRALSVATRTGIASDCATAALLKRIAGEKSHQPRKLLEQPTSVSLRFQ